MIRPDTGQDWARRLGWVRIHGRKKGPTCHLVLRAVVQARGDNVSIGMRLFKYPAFPCHGLPCHVMSCPGRPSSPDADTPEAFPGRLISVTVRWKREDAIYVVVEGKNQLWTR